jgi:hypothetical protein
VIREPEPSVGSVFKKIGSDLANGAGAVANAAGGLHNLKEGWTDVKDIYGAVSPYLKAVRREEYVYF